MQSVHSNRASYCRFFRVNKTFNVLFVARYSVAMCSFTLNSMLLPSIHVSHEDLPQHRLYCVHLLGIRVSIQYSHMHGTSRGANKCFAVFSLVFLFSYFLLLFHFIANINGFSTVFSFTDLMPWTIYYEYVICPLKWKKFLIIACDNSVSVFGWGFFGHKSIMIIMRKTICLFFDSNAMWHGI